MQTSVCHMNVPLGIDIPPVFSWIPTIEKRGDAQSAYRLIISSTDELVLAEEGDVWDSGVVLSSVFTEVPYGGKPLRSKTNYFWQVIVYCGERVQKSQVESFRTGIFRQDEWEGVWIGEKERNVLSLAGANWIGMSSGAETSYFRKRLPVADKAIKRLTIGLKGNDTVTLYVNGTILGTQAYRYTGVQYDVTKLLNSEENLIAILAQRTPARPDGVIVKVKIEYSDGTMSTLVSDDSWQVSNKCVDDWQELSFVEKAGEWQRATQLGLFGEGEWGDNISLESEGNRAAVRLRKVFHTTKELNAAYVSICGLGFFDLTINGQQVDNSVMNPFNSQFDRRVLYRTFDVGNLVQKGENAIGIELGNGFYNEIGGVWNWATASWRDNPKARLNLELYYSDGSSETVATDESWKVSTDGPITDNSYYYGEIYDARKEQRDWNNASYDDSKWHFAKAVKEPAPLRAQLKAPVREMESFKPKAIQRLADKSYLISGQEMVAGWLELSQIDEVAGTEITITYGQSLNEDGTVKRYGGADGEIAFWWPHRYLQQDKYICKGGGKEQFKPKYSYKGHQYIQIEGLTTELTEENITIFRTTNDIATISYFDSSNELFNHLHQMMKRAMANNFHGDHCDPVIEKIGWTGDANVSLDCLMFNYDMRGSLIGWLETMADGFDKYGIVPLVAPTANWGIENYVVWNSLFVYGVQYLEKHYGVSDYVIRQYPVMSRYTLGQIDVLRKNDWIWPADELGDWVAPIGGSDPAVAYNENTSEGSGITGTAMIYGVIGYMEQLAEKMNLVGDMNYYRDIRRKIYQAFQQAYYKADLGRYQTNTWNQIGRRTRYRQSDNLVALAFDLVPENHRSRVVAHLVADIQEKGEHLDTGCVGTRYLLPVLSNYGYSELAYRIANKQTYPSWGYWVANGASSTWEMWEKTTRSYDHYFLGTYDEWFYSHLAGIQQIKNGYEKLIIKPEFSIALEHVTCEIDTVRGKLVVAWQRLDTNKLLCHITIPFGSSAQVVFPFGETSIQLDGKSLSNEIQGVKKTIYEASETIIIAEAGDYQFSCVEPLV
ncbi:family 78 glycoside hydrolase catalytic domain [Vagococcus sp. BWB3-3]|uniref:alpha-L-rhamnosidase n=1 Tax=Vagococcus allomyrinae TaxID=2794353 RepID=A0A940P6E6_9ENTE|nr:family 78 glycoside hydrolase catalytic domain [Vagococcus allomyrinae]MBP1041900.1 family 78 glycoside hydrolase catalytic domain [Vagococcus allomyrinae]